MSRVPKLDVSSAEYGGGGNLSLYRCPEAQSLEIKFKTLPLLKCATVFSTRIRKRGERSLLLFKESSTVAQARIIVQVKLHFWKEKVKVGYRYSSGDGYVIFNLLS